MKELFTGFLSVSLSGSIIIAIVFALRLAFKKVPKALLCALWALLILRLLIPVQIESPFSLRPETPVFSSIDTQLFGEKELYNEDEVPEFLPTQVEEQIYTGQMVTIDYMMILAVIWSIIGLGMLVYALTTYIQLKYCVREAIRIESGVYESPQLNTAFLLGYIRPKIYLPSDLSRDDAALVIAHEKAHIRRGDNWLKLIAFFALALHWFNPLVWVAYVLICRDVEDACDERVIRNLDEQERVRYSAALLSCSKGRKTRAVCPVAFGEISIRQRILNVLNYRKPTLWVCIVAIIVILATVLFFFADPTKGQVLHLPYYDKLCASVGKPIEEVCSNLGISEDELIDSLSYTYELATKIQYKGIDFKINLSTNVMEEEEVLHFFSYWGEVPSDQERAAEIATDIGHELLTMFGDPDIEQEGRYYVSVKDLTEEKLLESYENKGETGVVGAFWDLSHIATSEVIDYIHAYGDTNDWKKRPPNNRTPSVPNPQFYLYFNTFRVENSERVLIKLTFNVGEVPSTLGYIIS